jgi:RHH-type proline utilization regulon transcriptional repressor/proline dehydrogenase/delta 1-pyrroline-5-carboxylate dehydrogenase
MLLEQARLPKEKADATQKLAMGIAEKLRNQKSASGVRAWCRGCCRVLPLLPGRGGPDVPGRGAAAHPRQGDPRC